MKQNFSRGCSLVGLLLAGFSTTWARAETNGSDRLVRVAGISQDKGDKPVAACCDLTPGDRVQWLGSAPPTLGTFVCCDAEYEYPLLITWDNLTGEGGTDQCIFCDEPTTCTWPEGSAFWTNCGSIVPVSSGCSADYTVNASGIWQGNTCGAGNECDTVASEERVYEVILPQSGVWIFSLCDSGYDTIVLIGTSPGTYDIAYLDDSGECGLSGYVTLSLDAGTYYVTIEGYGSSCGSYILDIHCEGCQTPVCGDGVCDDGETCENCPSDCGSCSACVADHSVSAPGQWQGNTCGAGNECTVWSSPEHVYKVAIPTAGDWTISLCGSNYDTYMSVGTTPGGSQIGENDDGACGLQSELTANLSPGTYYVTIESYYSDGCGAYVLTAESGTCEPPPTPTDPLPADGATDVPIDAVLTWNGTPAAVVNSPQPKLVYGDDDRLDEYQVSDPALRAVGDSTVVLVSTSYLTDNGNGTYTLPSTTFNQYMQAVYGNSLCSGEPFRNQPNPGRCSGFLVAEDIIATAGHCIRDTSDCSSNAFVFGFVMENATSAKLTVPAEDVYFCSEIIGREENGADWGLIRLDRPVVGHAPVSVRNSGQVATGQDLMMVGHPVGLPRKYAAGATVRSNSEPDYFEANVDAYGGNSGSAVFNLDTLQVEGILVRGNTDFVNIGCIESNWCPDTGCPGWEDITRSTVFSDLIPSFEVSFGVCGQQPSVYTTNTLHFDPPGDLQPCTEYCWSVTATNECGSTSSPTWSFTTAGCQQKPNLTAAVSRRQHGQCGACDLSIPLDGYLVDPRACMSGQIVLTYDTAPSDPGCGGISIVNGTCLATAVAGTDLIVDLDLFPNACVQVTDAYGNMVQMVSHIGNVNGDSDVNVIDLQDVKNHVFQTFDCSLARYDVNCDCTLNVIDLQETKNNVFEPASCPD